MGVTTTIPCGVLGSYSYRLCALLQQHLPPQLGPFLSRACAAAFGSGGGARLLNSARARAEQTPPTAKAAATAALTQSSDVQRDSPRPVGESRPMDGAGCEDRQGQGVVEAHQAGDGSVYRTRCSQQQPQHRQHRRGSHGAAQKLEEVWWGHGACYDLGSDFGAVARPAPAGADAGSATSVRKEGSAAGGEGGGAEGSGAGVRLTLSSTAVGGAVSAAAHDDRETIASERRRGLQGSGEAGQRLARRASSSSSGSSSSSDSSSSNSSSSDSMSHAGAAGGSGGGGGGFSPVLYLAPLTGTGLQARLKNKPRVPAWWCSRSTPDWFTLWPALQSVLPPAFPCYADNLRLEPARGADCPPAADGSTAPPVCAVSPAGVEVRLGGAFGDTPPGGGEGAGGAEGEGGGGAGGEGAGGSGGVRGGGAGGRRLAADGTSGDGGGGSTEGVEELGPWGAVASRLRLLGWPAELLQVHPYDWRLNPSAWRRPGGDFARLKDTIERLVAAAGGRRVVLYGVSLGGSYAAAFLDTRAAGAAALGITEAWKAAHVERLVTNSGVWEGTTHSVWDLLSGRLEGWSKCWAGTQ